MGNSKNSSKNNNSSIKYSSKTPNKWTMWAHLPHDTNWTLESYKNIYTISNIGEGITSSSLYLFEISPIQTFLLSLAA